MRKLDFFRLLAPMCAGTAAGACSLKKSNFLMFSKVLRKAPDQANWYCAQDMHFRCQRLDSSQADFFGIENR